METTSPPPTAPKNFRRAFALNFFLPGAGQIYLGQRMMGALLAGVFLVCLCASLAIFVIGYASYLNVTLSGNILEGNRLEQLGEVFHPRWLLGLMSAGIACYFVGLAGLVITRRQAEKSSPGKV